MKFEDILPALKAGRMARRRAWEEGRCIVASFMRGFEPDIREHQRYDRESSYSGWYSLRVSHDLLADDWELIVEIGQESYSDGRVRELLTEMAQHVKREVEAKRFDQRGNLGTMLHELMEVYAKQPLDRERLKMAVVHGLVALYDQP